MPEIRDPIHGFISVSCDERKIIDTRYFQRLRRIRQLGTTYLLYPAAEHTRFPHSLGVMHISSLIFDKLVEKRGTVLRWSSAEKEKYKQMLRLASLLHDLGHAPFSHVSDDLFDAALKGHEGMAAKMITETEIGQIIDKIGREHGFGSKDIAAMIMGQVFTKEEQLITNIFSSELDSDKMDYLLRDSLFTGVKYGYYDLDRVLNVLNLFPKDGGWIVGVDHDGVQAVEGLILARYFMFAQVYLHRTRRIYDKIMVNLLKDLLLEKNGKKRLPTNPEKFILWDDDAVLQEAKNSSSLWAERFLNRKHLKCVWETDPRPLKEERAYQTRIKDELESRYKSSQVIVDQYQKAPIKFDIDGTPTIHVLSNQSATEAFSFRDKAPIVAKLEEPIYIFRVYTDEENAKEVKDYADMRYVILKGGGN
ncbi:HD domain-containing protein [Desulforamulus ruminis]|uniref:Metal-dependent phosphohydrolase HD region n=1 Tax=Desulforamulus ruminis (strain ATCC 23193 / DSM 2154 / NCIMB 8452 / DL) TaxID=696281 RepID=F6DMS9_DESRL|nr:HD domain-containing protein [Desulforamulus ruminis]AEG58487.1 metal-dependent phosphohydrolase HD region [Desulforamulus ruminis DSM 2154]